MWCLNAFFNELQHFFKIYNRSFLFMYLPEKLGEVYIYTIS